MVNFFKKKINTLEDFPKWICPGCEYTTDTENWRTQRNKHRKSCTYYKDKAEHQYEHSDSRCCCCVHSYHDSKASKIQAPKVTFFLAIYKKCYDYEEQTFFETKIFTWGY